MSQQQHPRLRAVDFPVFLSCAESTAHDKRIADRSPARTTVETDVHSVIRIDEAEHEGSALVRCEP